MIQIVSELEKSNEENYIKVHYAKSGDKVVAIADKNMQQYVIGDDAEAIKITETSLGTKVSNKNIIIVDDYQDLSKINTTSFSLADSNSLKTISDIPTIDTKSEKVFAKIVKINATSVIINLHLPKGEIRVELEALNRILEKRNLLELGAEFYYVTVEKESGIEVIFEPYSREYKPEIEAVYDFLKEDNSEC